MVSMNESDVLNERGPPSIKMTVTPAKLERCLLEFFVNGRSEGAASVIFHVVQLDLLKVHLHVQPEYNKSSNFNKCFYLFI